MLLRTVIITLVLSFGWVGVLVGLQVLRGTAYNFRSETQRVLELIRDGNAAQVFSEASPRMQRDMIEESFLELASDIRATLGGFREILAIKQIAHISGPGGETGRAKATLVFDRGKTSGTFSYHRTGGAWRLLGFDIDIPESLQADALSRSETRAVRIEAPAEVHALARELLEQVRDGHSAAIYDQAAPTFKQSIAQSAFLELQRQRHQALGRYVRILDTLASWRNQSRTMATVTVVAQYDKAKTSVTMGFIRLGEDWKLSQYKVVMPPPRLPETTQGP